MRTLNLLACLGLAVAQSMSAQVVANFNNGFENSGRILDGNLNPWSDTRTINASPTDGIVSVSVALDISSSYNGDLYAYLSHDGVMVPLLNRVGVGTGNAFGYGDAGLNVTLTDGAPNNIHLYQTVGGYSVSGGAVWQPDGRTINPVMSTPSAFDAPGTVTLATYAGMNPTGDWTLVLADLAAGGGQATLVSWGLNITAVPEPMSTGLVTCVALGIFGFIRLLPRNVHSPGPRRTDRRSAH